MPDYLPLCALRQDLLPAACRSCAWWLTCGPAPTGQQTAYAARREWMTALEPTWGSTGLLHPASSPGSENPGLETVAAVHYAPVNGVPRLRQLPLGPLPNDSVLLFCLRVESEPSHALGRRLLQKALTQLRLRGVDEVFAYASVVGGSEGGAHCEFFSLRTLEDCGFRYIRDNGDLFLMKAELGGLASVVSQLERALRRALGGDPTPSPAAWSSQETP